MEACSLVLLKGVGRWYVHFHTLAPWLECLIAGNTLAGVEAVDVAVDTVADTAAGYTALRSLMAYTCSGPAVEVSLADRHGWGQGRWAVVGDIDR